MGDFNAISSQNEKSGGNFKPQSVIDAFNSFIDAHSLANLGMVGRPFTWTNRRRGEALIQERLDRISNTNSKRRIEQIQGQIEALRIEGTFGGQELIELERQLEIAFHDEEMYWKAKSRIKWLQAGDQNTQFFHQKFRNRTRRNKIWKLEGDNGEVATTNAGIAEVAESYFRGLFTSKCQANPEPYFTDFEPKVTTSMNRRLRRPITIEEVRRATFSIHPQSAPGEDGMTAKFFQNFWNIVNGNVFRAIRSFFISGRILKSLNHTQICLIPKVPDANTMNQVQPISLSSVISKVMVHRLQGMMPKLISLNQGAFIKSRLISDNILIAHEYMHYLKLSDRRFSGQQVNLAKSAIFFSNNTPTSVRTQLAEALNINHIEAQDKYLDLPSIVSKSKKATFSFVKEKVRNKVQGWKRSLLSAGGRQVLLKAVGEAISIYTLSCFRLPDSLISDIHSILTQFWWGQKGSQRRMAWISWNTMTRPKKEGGLGFKDLKAQNLALLGKHFWRILTQPNSLVTKILKGKYHKYTDALKAEIGSSPSWGWRSLLERRSVVEKGITWRIGSASQLHIYEDHWLPPPYPFTITRSPHHPNLGHVAYKILTLNIEPGADELQWVLNKGGTYDAASGYSVAYQFNHDPIEFCPQLMRQKDVWVTLWKLALPHKIKIFLWKSIHQGLPVCHLLHHRFPSTSAICSCCSEEDETVLHCLVTCKYAKEVWNQSPLAYLLATSPSSTSTQWWISSMEALKSSPNRQTHSHFLVILLWFLWKERNSWIFEHKQRSPVEVLSSACKHHDELLRLSSSLLT
ncbi:uncharacterized protein LOC130939336 [Arachis stenosperma]|uniref:uncharacterized protein LOC130939336 n=1 Tax=Arachis stenosperma TaxID=217475 RepID=UPI0025AC4657|nr:uncharacterized protein LOC130939336 [Arachis stenosperma]